MTLILQFTCNLMNADTWENKSSVMMVIRHEHNGPDGMEYGTMNDNILSSFDGAFIKGK